MNVQLVASEKLAQCPLEMWDIVLHQNSLEEASEHLCGWLDEYWTASHPPARQMPEGPNSVTSALQVTIQHEPYHSNYTKISQLEGFLSGAYRNPWFLVSSKPYLVVFRTCPCSD